MNVLIRNESDFICMLQSNPIERNPMPEITSQFQTVRSKTEHLCRLFSSDDHMLQADVFVSPPKWHLAHTSWFFEEMILKQYAQGYIEFNPVFTKLFNSYYETVGKRISRDKRHLISRPDLAEVHAYRQYVDAAVCQLIKESSNKTVKTLVELGLQHEQQHQELLVTDLKYSLFQNPILPEVTNQINLVAHENTALDWLKVEAGMHDIGHRTTDFCFDNELNPHRVFLEAFEVCSGLVTNGEYKEFIADGGYQNFRFWHDEGWAWVKENQLNAPLYWHETDGNWSQYTFDGPKPVEDAHVLAHISFFEAAAFAQWKGLRLLTEFEWEAASALFDWGQRWEWTNSAYLPYPGFKTSDDAVGEYNGKFMSNQMVLRGASAATAEGHSRKTYRNFFPTDARWQCTGIRLAK